MIRTWGNKKFKHPDTGQMVEFYSLPYKTQRELNKWLLPVWTMKDGNKISPKDMKTSHIENALRMLKRNAPAPVGKNQNRFIDIFEDELESRKE